MAKVKLDKRIKDVIDGKIPVDKLRTVEQEGYDEFFKTSPKVGTKSKKTSDTPSTIKLGVNRTTEVKTIEKDNKKDVEEYIRTKNDLNDTLSKYGIEEVKDLQELLGALYKKQDGRDPKALDKLLKRMKKEHKLSSEAIQDINNAFNDHEKSVSKALSSRDFSEALDFLKETMSDEVKKTFGKVLDYLKGSNTSVSSDLKIKHTDSIDTIKEKVMNSLTDDLQDDDEFISLTKLEKLGIYDVPVNHVTRDYCCSYPNDPKNLIKHNKPTYDKIVSKKESDKDCIIGKNAQVLPLYQLPIKTLVLMRDASDNIKFDIVEFKEGSPVGKDCKSELFKPGYFITNTDFEIGNKELSKLFRFFYPLRLDALGNLPIVTNEDGFNIAGSMLVNLTTMPTDSVVIGKCNNEQIMDGFITVTGIHLHEHLLRILGKYATSKEDMSRVLIERLSSVETFMPAVKLGDGVGSLNNLRDDVIRGILTTNNMDISLLVSLGIIDPYKTLRLMYLPDQPTDTTFLMTAADTNGSEDYKKNFICNVLRLVDYDRNERLELLSTMEQVITPIHDKIRKNRNKDTLVELVKYTYNLLHTFRIYYDLDEEDVDRIRTAKDAIKKAIESGGNNFALNTEGINQIFMCMDKMIENGPSKYDTSITLCTRAIGVGVGLLEHTFVDKVTPVEKVTKILKDISRSRAKVNKKNSPKSKTEVTKSKSKSKTTKPKAESKTKK